MAITNFIMDAFDLKPDQVKSFDYQKINGVYNIHITLNDSRPVCPVCGGPVRIKDYRRHIYHHLPFGGIPSVIIWHRRRYICKDCGKVFYEEPNRFGPDNFHQSYAVLRGIAVSLRSPHCTYKDIGKRYGVSSELVSLYADSFLHVPRQPLPENLGIDEISSKMSKYGGSYLCVLVDNQERNLVEILPDRSKKSLSDYFENIPVSERDRVRYVTMDLWDPYRQVVKKYFKHAVVAADPYHVVSHLTADFTRMRIDLMNQCVYGSPEYYLLKNWNKLFLADSSKFDNEPVYNHFFRQKMNYRDLFNLLLGINSDLKTAYYLMSSYRAFNKKATENDCAEQLDALIDAFTNCDIRYYAEFIGILHSWHDEIINSFKRPGGYTRLSNAITENMNGQIRTLINVSNGCSNFERFRARVIYCYNKKVFYSLTQVLDSRKREGRKRGHYQKTGKESSAEHFQQNNH